MTKRDNAWFIENAGNKDQWRADSRALRAQAAALYDQANRLDDDANLLPADIEMFEGQAIRVEYGSIYDGRTSIRYASLPSRRTAHVYQCANRTGKWGGSLEAFDFDSQKVYDWRVYSGGLFVGFHDSEDALIEMAQRWVALGTLPKEGSY